jgi:parallel beta-helix repeat protein
MDVVGQLGGMVFASTGTDDYVYFSQGNVLVTAQLNNHQLIKTATSTLPAVAQDLVVSGSYLYIIFSHIDYQHRLEIWDISNPAVPQYASYINFDSDTETFNKLCVDGNFLYIMKGNDQDIESIFILDLTDPVFPQSVTTFGQKMSAFTVKNNKGYGLYGDDWNSLTNKLVVLDLSDKTNIQEQGEIVVPYGERLAVDTDRVFVTCDQTRGLVVADVSNPLLPALIGQYGVGIETYSELFYNNNHLYIDARRKIHVIDVTDGTQPQLVINYDLDWFVHIDQVTSIDLIYRMNQKLNILDVSDPANPQPGDTIDEPTQIRSQTIQGNLYFGIGDEEVVIYDISDPDSPSLVSRLDINSANKVFVNGQRVLIADWGTSLFIYELDGSNTLQLQSTYTTSNPVMDITWHGNYISILTSVFPKAGATADIEVINISDLKNPVRSDIYTLPGVGSDIQMALDDTLLIATYNVVENGQGFQLIGMSQPETPVLLKQMETNILPQSLVIVDSLLFVGYNSDPDTGYAEVRVYNIIDPTDPVLLQTFQSALSGPIYEMIYLNGILFASFKNTGVASFAYDIETNNFSEGPSVDYEDALLINGYVPQSLDKLIPELSPVERYLYVVGGYAYDHELLGKQGVKIIKAGGGGSGPDVYTLKVQIDPAEAANKGANVEVTPDKAEYSEGESVALKAINGEDGWAFKEYSGDASGNSKETTVAMTGAKKNKEVTAHYVQPILTVTSEFSPREVVCPCDVNDKLFYVWRLYFKADEDDDWLVKSVKLQNTKDKYGIEFAFLHAGLNFSKGTFNADTSEITFTFSESPVVPANSTIIMDVDFSMKIDAEMPTCLIDKAYEYQLQLKKLAHVNADPVTYDNGLILGPTPTNSNSVFIARVENFSGWGFGSIQEAIESELTSEADILELCPGVYTEDVVVKKSLTIKSKEGREKTVVKMTPDNMSAIFKIMADNVRIEDLTISGEGRKKDKYVPGIAVWDGIKNIEIHNNYIFNVFEGITLYNTSGNCVIDSNLIEDTHPVGIKLDERSRGFTIKHNTIKNVMEGIRVEDQCNNINIEKNHFEKNKSAMVLESIENSTIHGNTFKDFSSANVKYDPVILLYEECKDNRIYNHSISDSGVFIKSKANFKNTISNNSVYKLVIQSTTKHVVDSNTVTQLIVQYSDKGNKFRYNLISNPNGTGIICEYSDENEFIGNKVMQCKGNGIRLGKDNNNFARSLKNRFSLNIITGSDSSGFVLFNSHQNTFYRNTITNNKRYGIRLYDCGYITFEDMEIMYNEIANNTLYGISVESTYNVLIDLNDIHHNGKGGIYLNRGQDTRIESNKIHHHITTKKYTGYGIDCENHSRIDLKNNNIYKNCEGLWLSYGSYAYAEGNTIKNSKCSHTGIHVDQASIDLFYNQLINNTGDGIWLENGGTANIAQNNIYGNSGFGVNNMDASITIDANDNWWGNASGPSGSDVNGNITAVSWASTPVVMVATMEYDTLFLAVDQQDSNRVFFQNFNNPDDVIDVHIQDNLGWITDTLRTGIAMQDSIGAIVSIDIPVPSGQVSTTNNWVHVTGQSQNDSNVSASDSCLVIAYEQVVSQFSVMPDTIQLMTGQFFQFKALCVDQYQNSISAEVDWQAVGGTIDSSGTFTAGDTTGIFLVTAKMRHSQMEALAVVIIQDNTDVDEEVDRTLPAEFVLYQNYPNPFNPVTTIKFDLPGTAFVSLKVFNIAGQKIRTLINRKIQAGHQSVVWDGKNESGNQMPSGMYIYIIRAGEFRQSRKMILMK